MYFSTFLEHFCLRRNFLTLLMLKYPRFIYDGKSSAKCMALNLVRHQLFLYAAPQILGARREFFP